MAKSRIPMQVSDKFLLKIKDLQRKIRMSTGNDRSLRDLTEDLANMPFFDELEKKICKGDNVLKGDIKLKLDVRGVRF